ncbi:MAG TPA: hypothetical protein VHV75_02760 [Solirubrobacteraceae bacterium]|jgi:hypothetical protein|nr:hypothetical protein [Solirubrobacteraceae bacterium]
MRLDALSKDDSIVAGLALLLAIDLVFLPWFSFSIISLTATDGPDSWTGLIAVLAAIAVVADVLIERMSPQTTLPNLGGSRTATRLRLAAIAALFVALKFILNVHFNLFGFGFWAGVVLAAALLFATLRASQDKAILAPR